VSTCDLHDEVNFISPLFFTAWCNAWCSKPLGLLQNVNY
jgi:hypothetical protein